MRMMLPVVVLVLLIFSTAEDEVVTNAKEGEYCIIETLSAIRSQATATNIYLEEIRKTLDVYEKRLDEVDNKLKLLDMVDDRLDNLETSLEDVKAVVGENGVMTATRFDNLETSLEDVKAVVEENGVMTATIKIRQKTMLSEVRLISLYKMTNMSTSGDHISGLAVDGQFDAITHTTTYDPNQKLWIDLGGVFRIYRVLVWNRLDCCAERFIGTQIYADERLLGVAAASKTSYEYTVSENELVYARSVILHQPHAEYLHVREVQVWGTGPFAEDDRFN